MQRKTSLFHKAIVKRNIIPHIVVTALLTLEYLLTGPIAYWRDSISFKEYGYETFDDLLSATQFGIWDYCAHSRHLEMLLILAAIMAFVNFYYMFDKRTTQSLHAMPFTRTQLFVTSYLKGLMPIVIPPLISMLCWLPMGTNKISYLPGPGVLIYEHLLFIVGGLMFYSMAVLLNMICGVWYLAPVLYVIFNYLYLLLKAIITFALSSVVYGFTYDYLNVLTDTSKRDMILSPRSFLVLGCVPNANYVGLNHAVYEYGYRFLWYILPIVLFTILAYVAYQRRPIERTGDFLIKPWLKTFFSIGITGCASVVAIYLIFELRNVGVNYNKQIWLNVLIIVVVSLIIYILISALFEKTFQIVRRKSVLIPAGIVAVVMGIFLAGLQTDVLGIGSRLPKEEDVERAALEIFYNGYRYTDFKDDIDNYNDYYADTTDIADVIEMHKILLENKEYVLGSTSDSELRIMVHYLMKDGSVMLRAYNFPLYKDDLDDKDSVCSYIDKKYNNPDKAFKDVREGRTPEKAYISAYAYNSRIGDYQRDLDPAGLDEAVMKDIAAGNMKLVYFNAGWYYDDSPYAKMYNLYNAVIRVTYSGGKRWGNYDRFTVDEFGTDISPDYSSDGNGVEISFYITDKCENILKFLEESGVNLDDIGLYNDLQLD